MRKLKKNGSSMFFSTALMNRTVYPSDAGKQVPLMVPQISTACNLWNVTDVLQVEVKLSRVGISLILAPVEPESPTDF